MVDVACPDCGQVFVADLAPDEDPWELEACEFEALDRLIHECPDHAHMFVVA